MSGTPTGKSRGEESAPKTEKAEEESGKLRKRLHVHARHAERERQAQDFQPGDAQGRDAGKTEKLRVYDVSGHETDSRSGGSPCSTVGFQAHGIEAAAKERNCGRRHSFMSQRAGFRSML